MANPLLSVETLVVERGGRVVIASLSFTLHVGEIVLVSGRNGAGKSTLLRTVSGLLAPVSGAIVYGSATDEIRGVETIHYLGYEDALKPSLTVGENLDFWARMLGGVAPQTSGPPGVGAPARGQVAQDPADISRLSTRDALAAFGIARLIDLPAAYLSAGQKRRVALARLLLAQRPLWLLDEPLIALDTGAQATLTAIMAAHVKQGGAILVASHQPLALPHREVSLDRSLDRSPA